MHPSPRTLKLFIEFHKVMCSDLLFYLIVFLQAMDSFSLTFIAIRMTPNSILYTKAGWNYKNLTLGTSFDIKTGNT